MNKDIFIQHGIDITPNQLQLFDKYRNLILEYNKVMDITNITDEEGMYIKHFLDSVLIKNSNINFNNVKLIDIGTGGGFPGIPLKIIYPSVNITLLDSLNKRVNFLNNVVKELDLRDVETIHGRAEEFARKDSYREVYDIAVSRAVAQLSTLIEYCLAYVKVGGYFISMKGPNYKEELKQASNSLKVMGGKVTDIIEYSLPNNNGDRTIIVIKKICSTPKKYPRGQGKPRNMPL